MSDLLTHWAVFEDCRRLVLLDDRIDPLLARVMQEEREFARLGAIARSGAAFVPHILSRHVKHTGKMARPACRGANWPLR